MLLCLNIRNTIINYSRNKDSSETCRRRGIIPKDTDQKELCTRDANKPISPPTRASCKLFLRFHFKIPKLHNSFVPSSLHCCGRSRRPATLCMRWLWRPWSWWGWEKQHTDREREAISIRTLRLKLLTSIRQVHCPWFIQSPSIRCEVKSLSVPHTSPVVEGTGGARDLPRGAFIKYPNHHQQHHQKMEKGGFIVEEEQVIWESKSWFSVDLWSECFEVKVQHWETSYTDHGGECGCWCCGLTRRYKKN